MDLRKYSSIALMLFWLLNSLPWKALCQGNSSSPEVSVTFLKVPSPLSNLNTAKFTYNVSEGGTIRRHCSFNHCRNCMLDGQFTKQCGGNVTSFKSLQDGNHTFKVCAKGYKGGLGCATYNWTIDTVAPTAQITTSTSFTSGHNVTANISFSEPCNLGGGFQCSSVNTCNLLVYGAGQVIPQSLTTLEPNLKYSLLISLSSQIQYGRVILAMDKDFCTDAAGNKFMRGENSSSIIHFDRRSVNVSMRVHVPEKEIEINGQVRTVRATNNKNNLKVYLYFSQPVVNMSSNIQDLLDVSNASLQPIPGDSHGNRRFGFLIVNISSSEVVTVKLNSDMVISRQGTPVSPVAPTTFVYDSTRPAVKLSTSSAMRTRESLVQALIEFTKPVFGFSSTHINISGGRLQSFQEMNNKVSYMVNIQALGALQISIPENVTSDAAGNRNLPSNVLQVRHYSNSVMASVAAIIVTVTFLVTALVAGLLTISTSSLQSSGAFSSPSLTSEPTRNLFRIACYIQVFALSRMLSVNIPVEYYEFTADLKWSIPYLNLPWENGQQTSQTISGPMSSFFATVENNNGEFRMAPGAPLSPAQYLSLIKLPTQKPQPGYIPNPQESNGWRDFERCMFWLAIIGGGLTLLHTFFLLVLKFRNSFNRGCAGGALVLTRFEIFLLILAIPCLCKASGSIIKGGTGSGKAVGILLLSIVSLLQLSLFIFLSFGITFGKLLQYKEVHQVGQKFHWYQELIRVTLGPGKRGQWTWKSKHEDETEVETETHQQSDYVKLAKYGPLFEDLRGPPKYMLSQITGGRNHHHNNNSTFKQKGDRIIASDDETEDAEAPFIQKLFGILRIYYTLIESLRRFILGILAGLYSHHHRGSRVPVLILLCITSFQLFFIVLKKPFIKKKVQLVEIISIACQVGNFAVMLFLQDHGYSPRMEKTLGISMIVLFLVGFLPMMINEWYALRKQVRQLDMRGKNCTMAGIKTASLGLMLFCFPEKLVKKLDNGLLENGADDHDEEPSEGGNKTSTPTDGQTRQNGSNGGRNSSKTTDRGWVRRAREITGSSFTRESTTDNNKSTTDPSTSYSMWSEFWSRKRSGRSGSSSMGSSTEPKPRTSRGWLYKDLEAIFAPSK